MAEKITVEEPLNREAIKTAARENMKKSGLVDADIAEIRAGKMTDPEKILKANKAWAEAHKSSPLSGRILEFALKNNAVDAVQKIKDLQKSVGAEPDGIVGLGTSAKYNDMHEAKDKDAEKKDAEKILKDLDGIQVKDVENTSSTALNAIAYDKDSSTVNGEKIRQKRIDQMKTAGNMIASISRKFKYPDGSAGASGPTGPSGSPSNALDNKGIRLATLEAVQKELQKSLSEKIQESLRKSAEEDARQAKDQNPVDRAARIANNLRSGVSSNMNSASSFINSLTAKAAGAYSYITGRQTEAAKLSDIADSSWNNGKSELNNGVSSLATAGSEGLRLATSLPLDTARYIGNISAVEVQNELANMLPDEGNNVQKLAAIQKEIDALKNT